VADLITRKDAFETPAISASSSDVTVQHSLLGIAATDGFKDPPAGPVPVSRRGRAQKERITRVAFDLFKSRPYNSITTTDISSRAELSTGTLYRYFVSKEAIFISVLERALLEMYDAARPVPGSADDSAKTIATNVNSYLIAFYHNRRIIGSARQLMTNSPPLFQMWCMMRKHIHHRMYQRLRQHQEESRVAALEPRGLITALTSMVDGYAQRAFIDEEFGALTEEHIRDAASALAGVWARALYGP
jgi:AcrR family transcriptional regulator